MVHLVYLHKGKNIVGAKEENEVFFFFVQRTEQ